MEIVKDLTEMLRQAEAKDKFYRISGTLVRLLASQKYQRPICIVKKGWGEIERVESVTDGTATDKRAPKKHARVRKGESVKHDADCWTFKVEEREIVEREGDLKKTETRKRLVLPFGTHFGLLKKSLYRSLQAQRKLRYDAPPLALMKVYPLWLDAGDYPCESMKEGKIPEVIMETRHTQGGDVMVEAYFDVIENRPFSFFMEIDSEAPINEEKLVALLKTLNTLDVVGTSKRGAMRIEHIEQVKLTEDEIRKLELGEAVEPVIY